MNGVSRPACAAALVFCAALPGWLLQAEGDPAARERSRSGKPSAAVLSSLAPRNITSTAESNEWNPRFSPDGRYLSYERRNGSAQAIFVADVGALDAPAQRVSSMAHQAPATPEQLLLGSGFVDPSFNNQLSFFPDGTRFVFTGNESSGVYRLYQGALDGETPQALTKGSKEDGHPAVSPDGRWLAYVSGREGVGKLFLRELSTGEERRLTWGDEVDLFPTWSPDSRSVAFTSGDNDNHDIFVLHGVTPPEGPPRPLEPAETVEPAQLVEPLQLTTWSFDDLRPIFSPDGSQIAFYSNYNPEGEDKVWSIVVVPADGSGPNKGLALAKKAMAINVVKDPEVGPAWLPGGEALVYALNRKKEFNPIHVVDTETGERTRIETTTRMNHDITCSKRGMLAFRAQVASWDDIFIAPLVKVP